MWISKEKYNGMKQKLEILERDNKQLWSKVTELFDKHSRLLEHLGLSEWTENAEVKPEKTILISQKSYTRKLRAKYKKSNPILQSQSLQKAQQQNALDWMKNLGSVGATRSNRY